MGVVLCRRKVERRDDCVADELCSFGSISETSPALSALAIAVETSERAKGLASFYPFIAPGWWILQ